jgi:hypothetical protein
MSITIPALKSGEDFGVTVIADGKCEELFAESQGLDLDSHGIMRLDVDSVVGENLARAEPRIFLSNQKLYLIWRSISEGFPALEKFLRRAGAYRWLNR